MYRIFSFLAPLSVIFFFFLFITTPLADAWIKNGDPCDPNSEMAARQQLPNFPNNSLPQSLQNNSCVYPVDVCTVDDPVSPVKMYHCKADPAANRAPGGGEKTNLRCTCLSPNTASPGNGYTCKNEAGVVVNTNDNTPNDYCKIDEQCQPGSDKDVRPISLNGETKFNTNQYNITGIICKATQGTAACTCDPADKTKMKCNTNPPAAPNSPLREEVATCNENFECSPTDPKKEVDRGQIKDGRTFMADRTLQGAECKRKTLTCGCVSPNTAGGLTCPQTGGPTLTPSCQNDYVCVPETDGSILLDGNTLQNVQGGVSTAMIQGVKCVNKADPKLRPPTPTIPPVPPPPCAPGKMAADGVCGSFLTDFGEIDTNIQGFILRLFAILLSISGGIALLLIIRAGYIMMTSAGNPEKVKEGREQLVAAIVGLLFIIFSFVILGVIGDDLLKIPGFVAG